MRVYQVCKHFDVPYESRICAHCQEPFEICMRCGVYIGFSFCSDRCRKARWAGQPAPNLVKADAPGQVASTHDLIYAVKAKPKPIEAHLVLSVTDFRSRHIFYDVKCDAELNTLLLHAGADGQPIWIKDNEFRACYPDSQWVIVTGESADDH